MLSPLDKQRVAVAHRIMVHIPETAMVEFVAACKSRDLERVAEMLGTTEQEIALGKRGLTAIAACVEELFGDTGQIRTEFRYLETLIFGEQLPKSLG